MYNAREVYISKTILTHWGSFSSSSKFTKANSYSSLCVSINLFELRRKLLMIDIELQANGCETFRQDLNNIYKPSRYIIKYKRHKRQGWESSGACSRINISMGFIHRWGTTTYGNYNIFPFFCRFKFHLHCGRPDYICYTNVYNSMTSYMVRTKSVHEPPIGEKASGHFLFLPHMTSQCVYP